MIMKEYVENCLSLNCDSYENPVVVYMVVSVP